MKINNIFGVGIIFALFVAVLQIGIVTASYTVATLSANTLSVTVGSNVLLTASATGYNTVPPNTILWSWYMVPGTNSINITNIEKYRLFKNTPLTSNNSYIFTPTKPGQYNFQVQSNGESTQTCTGSNCNHAITSSDTVTILVSAPASTPLTVNNLLSLGIGSNTQVINNLQTLDYNSLAPFYIEGNGLASGGTAPLSLTYTLIYPNGTSCTVGTTNTASYQTKVIGSGDGFKCQIQGPNPLDLTPPPGTYTVTLTATDSATHNNIASNTMSFTVYYPNVVGSSTYPTPQIDQGQSYSISDAETAGLSPYTYTWYEKTPSSVVIVAPNSVSTPETSSYLFKTTSTTPVGPYSFYANVIDNTQFPLMVTTLSEPIIVNSDPTVTLSPSTDLINGEESVTLMATGSGGTPLCSDCINYPTYTYAWYYNYKSGNVLIPSETSNTFTFSNSIPGTYNISVSITDGKGYTANSIPSVITVMGQFNAYSYLTLSNMPIKPLPTTLDINQSANVYGHLIVNNGIPPATGSFLSIISPSGSSCNIISSGSGGTGGAYQSIVAGYDARCFNVLIPGTYTVNMAASDSNSPPQKILTSNTFIVYSDPVLTTPSVSNSIVDQGQTSNIMIQSASGGLSPYTYQWYSESQGSTQFSTVGSSTSSNTPYTFITGSSVSPGTYLFESNVIDNTELPYAINSPTASVQVYSAPTVSTPIPNNAILNVGQSVVYTTILNGGVGPFTVTLINNGITVNTIIEPKGFNGIVTFGANIPSLGAQTFSVNAIDEGTTTPYTFNSLSNTILVNSDPTVSLTPSSSSVTTKSSVILTAKVSGGTLPYTYAWYNDTSGSNTLISGVTSNILTVTQSTAGTYKYSVNVNSANMIVESNVATISFSAPTTSTIITTQNTGFNSPVAPTTITPAAPPSSIPTTTVKPITHTQPNITTTNTTNTTKKNTTKSTNTTNVTKKTPTTTVLATTVATTAFPWWIILLLLLIIILILLYYYYNKKKQNKTTNKGKK